MQNGITWLQDLTDIFVEHHDPETQDWLLGCAIEKLDAKAWLSEINGLSLHNSIQDSWSRLIIHGICKHNIYACNKHWLALFKTLKFIKTNHFSIQKLSLKRNISLGNQSLNLSQYQQLSVGNIILLNNCNFNLDGIGLFNVGSFAMQVMYSDDHLIFQQWTTNMNDDNQDIHDWNLEDGSQENLADNPDADTDVLNADAVDTQSIGQEDKTHPFANIPINLHFSLGQLKLNVEEIMQLQAGAVLPLEKSLPAQVIIYANSKKIGAGEVVDIDGKLGIQILNLDDN
jgi:flagellar motor switch/type III secretory pathway protein FliN